MGVTLPVTTTICDFCTTKCARYSAAMWSSTQQMGMGIPTSSVVQCKGPTPQWILVSQVRQQTIIDEACLHSFTVNFHVTGEKVYGDVYYYIISQWTLVAQVKCCMWTYGTCTALCQSGLECHRQGGMLLCYRRGIELWCI